MVLSAVVLTAMAYCDSKLAGAQPLPTYPPAPTPTAQEIEYAKAVCDFWLIGEWGTTVPEHPLLRSWVQARVNKQARAIELTTTWKNADLRLYELTVDGGGWVVYEAIGCEPVYQYPGPGGAHVAPWLSVELDLYEKAARTHTWFGRSIDGRLLGPGTYLVMGWSEIRVPYEGGYIVRSLGTPPDRFELPPPAEGQDSAEAAVVPTPMPTRVPVVTPTPTPAPTATATPVPTPEPMRSPQEIRDSIHACVAELAAQAEPSDLYPEILFSTDVRVDDRARVIELVLTWRNTSPETVELTVYRYRLKVYEASRCEVVYWYPRTKAGPPKAWLYLRIQPHQTETETYVWYRRTSEGGPIHAGTYMLAVESQLRLFDNDLDRTTAEPVLFELPLPVWTHVPEHRWVIE